ncbi:MAG: NF038122 family metalloprotease [Acidobacteria bacterium]|nr:NF038122 family metalloprotease [Acidobacteriota bacterium]
MKKALLTGTMFLLASGPLLAGPPLSPAHGHDGWVIEAGENGIKCRDAAPADASLLRAPDASQLRVITPINHHRSALAPQAATITLRATAQLDGFPEAKAAFIRAAQRWQAALSSNVTIIIDVDFGPTRFGTPWPSENVIGSASGQALIGDFYGDLRTALRSSAANSAETSLYNLLPASSVPTDIGGTVKVISASAPLRALGLIDAVANPTAEEANFGKPPNIGFNSAFTFDTNSANGVDPTRIDFESVALHEIGHVLGFSSSVGSKESDPSQAVSLTPLDIFRFRPGVTNGTFTTASRILSSGGSHIFFAGGTTYAFSTGRPDGTMGDGQQASHWKDDGQTNVYIGLMDPTLRNGEVRNIEATDLLAMETIGWTTGSGGGGGGGGGTTVAETEPNETPDQANALTTLPATVTGRAVVGDATGINLTGSSGAVVDRIEDLFSVTLSSAGSLQLALSWTGSSNDLDLYVFLLNGSSLSLVGSSAAENTTSESVNLPTLAAGRYLIGVSAYAAGTNYSLTVAGTGVGGGGGGGGGNTNPCVENGTTMCLNGGRFEVKATYRTNEGQTGNGQAVRLTNDTGYFWFFQAANVEVVTKVLNGCFPGFNSYWVFAGGLTNVEVNLTYRDTRNGTIKTYKNNVNTAFQPIQDTGAFATCP